MRRGGSGGPGVPATRFVTRKGNADRPPSEHSTMSTNEYPKGDGGREINRSRNGTASLTQPKESTTAEKLEKTPEARNLMPVTSRFGPFSTVPLHIVQRSVSQCSAFDDVNESFYTNPDEEMCSFKPHEEEAAAGFFAFVRFAPLNSSGGAFWCVN